MTKPRQAVVVIHGIGEQRPMDTLRSFVVGVLGENHRADGGQAFYSKPDPNADGFELRRFRAFKGSSDSDFIEFYWQHQMPVAAWRFLYSWLWLLMRRPVREMPRRFAFLWWLAWGSLAALAMILVLAVVCWLGTPLVGETAVPEVPWIVAAAVAGLGGIVRAIVGDAAIYLNPHPRTVEARNAIRASGLALLERLQSDGRYDRIIVVGHSLGSVIGYDIVNFAWQRASEAFRRKVEGGDLPHAPAQPCLAAAEAAAVGSATAGDVWTGLVRAAARETRALGLRWLITDLITLGSPLAHARLLLARGAEDLARRAEERELPQSPPFEEDGKRFSYPRSWTAPEGKRLSARVPDHAAVFGFTVWHNLFFPCRWLLHGDLVGGAVAPAFGRGVHDSAVSTRIWRGWLAHTRYWSRFEGFEPGLSLLPRAYANRSTSIAIRFRPSGSPAGSAAPARESEPRCSDPGGPVRAAETAWCRRAALGSLPRPPRELSVANRGHGPAARWRNPGSTLRHGSRRGMTQPRAITEPAVPRQVFYSWQSDTPTATGRNLVRRALGDAIAALNADAELEHAERDAERLAILDQDTAGVPGSPPIAQTIFGKIDRAAAFVSDLTYVASRRDGRRCPNPNVLFEHGYAWSALGWRAVISVLNVAYGHPRDHPLPFDLQHSRGPVLFDCPDDADAERRRTVRAELARALGPRLRAILEDQMLGEAGGSPASEAPHPHDIELAKRWHALIDDPLRQYLREHHFGDAHERRRLAPLLEIAATWRGARFEFDDPELQRALAAFLAADRAFSSLLVERTWVLDRSPELADPKTDRDRSHGLQPVTLEAIDRLNALASTLGDAIDDLDRSIRTRLRVSLEPAAPTGPSQADRRAWADKTLGELAADGLRGGVPCLVSRPCAVIRIAPLSAADSGRLDPVLVERAQRRFPPDVSERIEEGTDARQWWTSAAPVTGRGPNRECAWLVRLVRPGLVEAQVSLGTRIDDDDAILVDGYAVERLLVGWSERLSQCLGEVGLAGPGVLHLSLEGAGDVVLTRARGGGRKIGVQSVFLGAASVDQLAAPLAPALQEALDILWQSGGWRDGSPSFAAGVWNGYREP